MSKDERFIVRSKEGKFAYRDQITPGREEIYWTYGRATIFTMEEASKLVRETIGTKAINVAE
jgi:hypothetical protein